jgi:F0F1-type ATP synthase delta subunit
MSNTLALNGVVEQYGQALLKLATVNNVIPEMTRDLSIIFEVFEEVKIERGSFVLDDQSVLLILKKTGYGYLSKYKKILSS